MYLCFLIKLFFFSFGKLFFLYYNIIFFLCLLSILIGSLGLLSVTDMKRFLVYGSINHIGFIFSCFFCGNLYSFICNFFYLVIYFFLLITFFCLFFFRNDKNVVYIYDLNILKNGNVLFLFVFCFCLFSMAGLPPFIGFFSKFLVSMNFYFYTNSLVVLVYILLFSLISVYGYIRVIAYLFFDSQKFFLYKIKANLIFYFFLFLFLCINGFGIIYFFDFFYFFLYIYFKFLFLC